jgi:hypothetical protein
VDRDATARLRDGLAGILEAHGEDWQVSQDEDTMVWTAVRRPSVSSMHVLVGHTLAELAAKLDDTAA